MEHQFISTQSHWFAAFVGRQARASSRLFKPTALAEIVTGKLALVQC